jgi:hypothetical protein
MDKREARKEFKSKKTPKGVFAIRCAATQGEEAFAYEVLEILDDDVSALLLKDVLLERQKHWEEKLGAPIA